MGDNAEQNTGENAVPLQQSNPIISIRPLLRERVVQIIGDTLRSRCKRQEHLVSVESIARRFEEKVFSVASDEKDYVTRISMKMKTLDRIPGISGTGGLSQLNSGNVRSENIKLDHQQVQSQNPSQLQPRQIINNNNNFTSQSSNLMDISRIPPNIEKKAPEQLTVVKDSISQPQRQPQVQQHQNIHKQLPNSRQVISKVAASGATTQSEQPEVLSVYRYQSVTKEQYESWQRDNAHQRKSVPTQQKLTPVEHEVQSSTLKNQQNISQSSRVHPQISMAGITAHNKELKRQNVQSHAMPLVPSHAQRISQQKVDVVREEKIHSSGLSYVSQNVLRPDMGTIQSRNLPSEESKRIGTSSAVERHKDTEGWREGIHQRKDKQLDIEEKNDFIRIAGPRAEFGSHDEMSASSKECKPT